MEKIGFIGLGHMGHPMTCNLLSAGYKLKVYDIVPEHVDALAKKGAIPCKNLHEVAIGVDVIITMVQTGQQVKDLCMVDNGLFARAKPGTLFIEASTIDVATSRKLHEMAEKKGFAMVDAPVSGGVAGAKAATLTIMVGGQAKNFKRALPILKVLGENIVHAGAEGNGQVAKMCNNMILGVSMIAVSEGFKLGEQLGLDPKVFFEIASKASSQCWSMTRYCPVPDILANVPSSNHYKPGFTSAMMLKDLMLSQEAAKEINAKTPMGMKAKMIYKRFVESGHANLDFSAIIKMFDKRK